MIPAIVSSMHTNQDWQRVASRLHRARQEKGYRLRSELVRQLVMDGQAKPSIDRILGDLERGARDNYSRSTLAAVELWYGLPSGEIARILDSTDAQEAKRLKQLAASAAVNGKHQLVADLGATGWTINGAEGMTADEIASLLTALAQELAGRQPNSR